MTAARETYPGTNVTLEIIDVGIPGDARNTGEVGTFRVKVTNTGPLHLDGVTLRIKGRLHHFGKMDAKHVSLIAEP